MKKKLYLLADRDRDRENSTTIREDIKRLENYGYDAVIPPYDFSYTGKTKKSIKALLKCSGVALIDYCNYESLLLDVAKSCGLKVYSSGIWIANAKKEKLNN